MINDDNTNTNNNDDNNNNNGNNDSNNNYESFNKKVFLQHQHLYTCSRKTLPEMGNKSLDTKQFAIPRIFPRYFYFLEL